MNIAYLDMASVVLVRVPTVYDEKLLNDMWELIVQQFLQLKKTEVGEFNITQNMIWKLFFIYNQTDHLSQ